MPGTFPKISPKNNRNFDAYYAALGNYAALGVVHEQAVRLSFANLLDTRVTTDPRSGITSDPNRPDDPEYIARLIGRVVTVSVETVRLVGALPPLETDRAGGTDRRG